VSATKPYLAYADGSCVGNPGPGGWGVVIVAPDGEETELSGHADSTTNNRMEITAAIEALRAIPEHTRVIVRSDSQYVVKTMNDGWRRRENLDLWPLLDTETRRHRVTFEWVRGHASDPLNERADTLARRAAALPAKGIAPAPLPSTSAEPLAGLLRPNETIRVCAGCGRRFVAIGGSRYCSQVDCQLKARVGSRQG
jgi:ribonuclease HI